MAVFVDGIEYMVGPSQPIGKLHGGWKDYGRIMFRGNAAVIFRMESTGARLSRDKLILCYTPTNSQNMVAHQLKTRSELLKGWS